MEKLKMIKKNNTLHWKEKSGFGFGMMGAMIPGSLKSSFIMIFYTDVFGITAAIAGTLIFLATIWDAISDVLMGVLVDNTNTRWGKCRPYLFIGGILSAILLTLAFYTPNLGQTAKIVYAYATYIGLGMAFTILVIPVKSLMSRMTDDASQRNQLGIIYVMSTSVVAVGATSCFYPLVKLFGEGSDQQGFFYAAAVFGILTMVFMALSSILVKEKVAIDVVNKVSLKQGIISYFQNKHIMVLSLATLIGGFASALIMLALPYYCTYYLGNKGIIGLVYATAYGGMFLVQPFLPAIAKKTGRRPLILIGYIFLMIGGTIKVFAGTHLVTNFIAFGIIGMGSGIANLLIVAFADCIDYSEWKFGFRSEGIIYASYSLIHKLGVALSSVVIGSILTIIHYVPNLEIQSDLTLRGLKFMTSELVIFLGIVNFIALWFYKLDAIHPQIVKELHERRGE